VKRRHFVVAAIVLAALAFGGSWLFFRPEPEMPAPPPPRSEREIAAAREAKAQLAAAVTAAFPRGTLISSGDRPPRLFDDHRLIEAPFGPVLVSHGYVPNAAHVDAGAIAVHYLAPAEDGFALVRDFPEAVEVGSSGELSDWSVSDKFSDLPVIQAEGGGTWQGYTCSYAVLSELTPRGPIELARIQTAYDDSGAKETGAQSIEGKIGEIAKGKSFVVRYGGTRSFVERYVRRGDRFVREGGKSQVPEC
jgi:hypothetical protein